jgi:hypothetical protein
MKLTLLLFFSSLVFLSQAQIPNSAKKIEKMLGGKRWEMDCKAVKQSLQELLLSDAKTAADTAMATSPEMQGMLDSAINEFCKLELGLEFLPKGVFKSYSGEAVHVRTWHLEEDLKRISIKNKEGKEERIITLIALSPKRLVVEMADENDAQQVTFVPYKKKSK